MSGLTRKEMKRDEVREGFEHGIDWVYEHGSTLLKIAGAVAVAATILGLGWLYVSSQERKGAQALAAAMEVYAAPIGGESSEGDDEETPSFVDEASRRAKAKELFTEVQESFGRTDAADVASVYLGEIAAQEGDLERARELWTRFVNRHPNHAVAGGVWLNLFSIDKQEGLTQELTSKLRALLEEPHEALPEDILLFELASVLEEDGQSQEARDTFQRLVDDHPRSTFAAEARSRLDALPAASGPLTSAG